MENMNRLWQNQSNNLLEQLIKSSFATQSVSQNASANQSQLISRLNLNTPTLINESNCNSAMPETEVQVNDSTAQLISSNDSLAQNLEQSHQRNFRFCNLEFYNNFLI